MTPEELDYRVVVWKLVYENFLLGLDRTSKAHLRLGLVRLRWLRDTIFEADTDLRDQLEALEDANASRTQG